MTKIRHVIPDTTAMRALRLLQRLNQARLHGDVQGVDKLDEELDHFDHKRGYARGGPPPLEPGRKRRHPWGPRWRVR